MISALELCNCCEVIRADPHSAPGYCAECAEAAEEGRRCAHDQDPD